MAIGSIIKTSFWLWMGFPYSLDFVTGPLTAHPHESLPVEEQTMFLPAFYSDNTS